MKYTSGPWKVDKGETEEPVIRNTDEDCLAVACTLFEGEAQANARLIAAAPDLLEACRLLLEEFNSRTALIETCDMTEEELMAIKKTAQAIAKAEGRD